MSEALGTYARPYGLANSEVLVIGAICRYCNLRMGDGQGCTLTAVWRTYPRIPYLAGRDAWPVHRDPLPELCHDCAAALGQFHHLGCDMEVCPRCGGQLFLCGCLGFIPAAGRVPG
jgi:hypothetical protein